MTCGRRKLEELRPRKAKPLVEIWTRTRGSAPGGLKALPESVGVGGIAVTTAAEHHKVLGCYASSLEFLTLRVHLGCRMHGIQGLRGS